MRDWSEPRNATTAVVGGVVVAAAAAQQFFELPHRLEFATFFLWMVAPMLGAHYLKEYADDMVGFRMLDVFVFINGGVAMVMIPDTPMWYKFACGIATGYGICKLHVRWLTNWESLSNPWKMDPEDIDEKFGD